MFQGLFLTLPANNNINEYVMIIANPICDNQLIVLDALIEEKENLHAELDILFAEKNLS